MADLADIDGILAIENLLELVAIGGREPRDSLAAFLMPYIRGGRLRMVAEVTPTELDACRRLLPGLVDALAQIKLEPMPVDSETELLRQTLKTRFQATKTSFDAEVPRLISRLCRQFQRHGASPGPSMISSMNLPVVAEPRSRLAIGPHRSRWNDSPNARACPSNCSMMKKRLSSQRCDAVIVARSHWPIGGVQHRRRCGDSHQVGRPGPCRPFACMLFCGPTVLVRPN